MAQTGYPYPPQPGYASPTGYPPQPAYPQPAGYPPPASGIPRRAAIRPPAAAADCVPACRAGFLCIRGQCLSACNPPCGPGEVCAEGGRCQPQTAPGSAPPTSAYSAGPYPSAPATDPALAGEAARAEPYRASIVGLTAELAGVLVYGPSVIVDIGGPFVGFGRVRMINAGLVSNAVAMSSDDSLKLSYGLGGGLRYYMSSRGSRQGFYIGASAEYLSIEAKEGDGSYSYDIYYPTTAVVGLVESGFRWRFGESFIMGVGGQVGYFGVLSADTKTTGSPAASYRNSTESMMLLLPNFELGLAF